MYKAVVNRQSPIFHLLILLSYCPGMCSTEVLRIVFPSTHSSFILSRFCSYKATGRIEGKGKDLTKLVIADSTTIEAVIHDSTDVHEDNSRA